MGIGAAPELPALGELLAAALPAIGWLVCLGMLWAYRRSLKRLILKFADLIDVDISVHGIGGKPLGGVAKWLEAQAENIDTLLGEGATACEHAASVLFKLFLQTQRWIATETADLATDAWHAIAGVKTTVVKPAVKVLDAKTSALVRQLTVAVGTVQRVAIPALRHRVDALAARVTRLARSTAGAIAAPIPRLGRLEKTAKAQGKRITRLEKLLAGGLGVAVVLRALSKLGLGWLRCGNVNKAGKAVCGMNPSLLEQLLLDAALLTVAFNLEDFARELGDVSEDAAGLIQRWAT